MAPAGRHGNIPGIILLLIALVLLILVSVSVPILKSIYFLRADFAGASFAGVGVGRSHVTLGMWGACFDGQGISRQCTKTHLGYDLDLSFLNLTSDSRFARAVIRGLSKALILHPIAAGVTFIALLFALSGNIFIDIIATLAAFLAFLITLVAFIIDCVLWITARHRINNVLDHSASLSNAFWMVLAALIAQLIASFLVCFGGRSRRTRADTTAYPPPMTQRRHFWQRRNPY